jgi:hypothetical protein
MNVKPSTAHVIPTYVPRQRGSATPTEGVGGMKPFWIARSDCRKCGAPLIALQSHSRPDLCPRCARMEAAERMSFRVE